MEIMHLFLYKNWQVNEFKSYCVNIKIYIKSFFKVQFSNIEPLKIFVSSEMHICMYVCTYSYSFIG